MRTILLACIAVSGFALSASAQSFSINTDGSIADTSAMLDVKSTNKGVLIPRMTKTQRNNIFTPANGLLIYQSGPDSIGFYYYQNGWKWIADNSKTDNSYWKLDGNAAITEPPTTGIFPVSGNFIGTTDNKDFVISTNGFERMRFKGSTANLGIGSPDPKYTIDASLSYDAVATCVRNGLRMKLPFSGINAACDVGYFMGYPNAASGTAIGNDIMFWNFDATSGSTNNGYRWGFGTDTAIGMMMKLKDYRLGIGQTSPLFSLDIKVNPDAVAPCLTNGIRITHPNLTSDCKTGIFLGYNPLNTTNGASIWNYGSTGSTNNYIRLGVNDDANGEVMRLVGHTVGINVTNPQAVLHITDVSAVRNGLRITQPATPTAGSFYFGSAGTGPYLLEVSTEYSEPIRFYTNHSAVIPPRMSIDAGGNVNIGPTTTTPTSTLKVEGTIAVGVTTGLAGGSPGSPTLLANLGAYVSLEPVGANVNYALPAANTCPGRIYYIRNNSTTIDASLRSVGGNLCPATNNSCSPIYSMPANGSQKTVMAISDGVNWTVGALN